MTVQNQTWTNNASKKTFRRPSRVVLASVYTPFIHSLNAFSPCLRCHCCRRHPLPRSSKWRAVRCSTIARLPLVPTRKVPSCHCTMPMPVQFQWKFLQYRYFRSHESRTDQFVRDNSIVPERYHWGHNTYHHDLSTWWPSIHESA